MSDEQSKGRPLDGLNIEESIVELKKRIVGGTSLQDVLDIARQDGRASMAKWADNIELAAMAMMNSKPAVHVEGVTGEGGIPHQDDKPEVAGAANGEAKPCFRFFAHNGCPRSFFLEPDHYEEVQDTHGKKSQRLVPGIRVVTVKFGGDKRVRVIDVPTLQACKRGEFQVKPDKIAALIMDCNWRGMDSIFEMKALAPGQEGTKIQVPMIQTETEYETLRIEEKDYAEHMKQQQRAFTEMQLAKRGKRGVDAAA